MTLETTYEDRNILDAMRKGVRHKCPSCGEGHIYSSYAKVKDECDACGEVLKHHRADDLPAYLTILIIGHLVVFNALSVEQAYQPALWVHVALWGPLTVIGSLLLIPRFKGAIVGLQWAKRMHGFGGHSEKIDY